MDNGQKMTAKEAAAFAGCSTSTLKRYCCGLCEQSLLRMLMWGCCSYFGPPCDPTEKKYFPWKRKNAHDPQ